MELKDKTASLLLRHFNGEMSPEDEIALQAWLELPGNKEFFETELTKHNILEYVEIVSKMDEHRMDQRLAEQMGFGDHSIRRRRLIPFLAAASILGAIVIGIVFLKHKPTSSIAPPPQTIVSDILPGGNKAVLTLSNGSAIILDSARNGTIAEQGNSTVQKLSNGQLSYNTSRGTAAEVMYNMVATPAGGQYQLTLQDGTKVWLNNASSLRYPVAFRGNERVVELKGEAYFEVTKNRAMPFKVMEDHMSVQVLGTHFDVKAYADEPFIKTTLLEGSVRVVATASTNNDKQGVMLQPGQQAQLFVGDDAKKGAGRLAIQKEVDTDEAIAWKNGYFQFNGADIQEVMRTLARWYNVKVRYEGEIPKIHSFGSISRFNTASDVLKVLQTSGFHFKIESDTIVIMP